MFSMKIQSNLRLRRGNSLVVTPRMKLKGLPRPMTEFRYQLGEASSRGERYRGYAEPLELG